MQEAWEGFKEGIWTGEVDVRDFIQKNYTPYEGDESFLAGPTERTKELWGEVLDLLLKEREQGGVLDMDTKTVTGIVSHPAGYIDNAHRDKETIVGLQTDKPLKRALHVNGGIRIACQAASQHGYRIDENVVERYTFERKTHNAGVFDVYTHRCAPAVRPTSSPVCPMAMAAAASSATTVVSPCTVSTT